MRGDRAIERFLFLLLIFLCYHNADSEIIILEANLDVSVKERRYLQRKREIIDAAAMVFAEKGYHGASTKDIAGVLGIQQGSLYHYVTSKEEALEEVCWEGVEGFVSGAKKILATDMVTVRKLEEAVANHLLPMKDRQDYVIVFNNERHHLPDEKRRRIGKSSQQYETIIETIFKDGIIAGDLRDDLDPRLATLSFIGLCNSATPWLGKSSNFSIEEVVKTFSTILTSGVIKR